MHFLQVSNEDASNNEIIEIKESSSLGNSLKY
jgi:hypothetical protein